MKKIFAVLVCWLVLCSCSPAEPELVKLCDPCPLRAASYRSMPTIKELLHDKTHVAIVELKDAEPWGDTGRSIFTFTIKSLLAGEKFADEIKIINPTSLYLFEETYLLFLSYFGSTLYPFDFYVPFDPYTFRISEGEFIDCLQAVEDSLAGTPRRYVEPFQNPEHNRLSYLQDYISKYSRSVKKSKPVSENIDLLYLIEKSRLIMGIVPKTVEPVPVNGSLVDVSYDVSTCYKGTPQGNWLMMPSGIEPGSEYLVFLIEREPGFFVLTSRGSFFQLGSKEYSEFLALWENK